MIPQRFAPILFGLILSGFMTFCVTAIATYRATGFGDAFMAHWMGSWVASCIVAFPLVLIFGPITRKLVQRIVAKD